MSDTPNGRIQPGFSNFISLAAQHIRERESEILNDLGEPIEDELELMDAEYIEPDVAGIEDEPSNPEQNGRIEDPVGESKPPDDEFARDSSDDNESLSCEDDSDANADDTVESLKKQGDEHFHKGLWNEAIEYYSKALQCCQMATLYGNRSLCYMKVGDFAKAERDCCNAIELDPLYKRIYRRRAAIRLRRKDYYGSSRDLQSLRILSYNAQLDQNILEEYKALLPLARLVKMEGLDNVRAQTLEKAVLAKLCRIEESAAKSFKQRSMWSQVVESLSMAIVVSPSTPRLYYERAVANFKLGKANLAEKDCSEAIELEPSNHAYYRLRADIRRKLGKPLESRSDEQTADKMSPPGAASRLEEPSTGSQTPPSSSKPPSRPEEPSKVVRIPVKDVYTTDREELSDLSKLPDQIRSSIKRKFDTMNE